jgi:hypothetical protein
MGEGAGTRGLLLLAACYRLSTSVGWKTRRGWCTKGPCSQGWGRGGLSPCALERANRGRRKPVSHKVLTYIEYRSVSGVFRNIDPPPPLHPASVSSPAPKVGGTHSPGRWGDGGSIFRMMPEIELASFSIILLRPHYSRFFNDTFVPIPLWFTGHTISWFWSS